MSAKPTAAGALTSAFVARSLGVELKTLQRWVRDGLVAARTTGSGRGRRIHWTEESVERARRIRDRVSGDSQLASSLGPDLAMALEHARKLVPNRGDGEVVVAGPSGARIVRSGDSVGEVIRRVGAGLGVILS